MKRILLIITCLFLSTFSAAWASDNEAAKQVIENWFAAMKNQQIDQAADYLAPQFVSIHTDGMVRDKKEEVKLMKKLDMKDYKLTDFRFSNSDDTVVVTYKDKGAEKIDNKSIAPKATGRMAVLQKEHDKWLIIAYANLDQIG